MGSVRPFLEGSLKQPWLKALAAFSLKQPAGKEEADFRPDTFRSTLLPRNRAILDLSLSLSLSLAYSLGHSLSLARSAKPRTIQPRGLDPPPRFGSPPLSFLIRLIRRVERGSSEEEKEEKEEEEEEEDPPRYTTPSRILRVDYVIRSFFRKTDTSLVVQ